MHSTEPIEKIAASVRQPARLAALVTTLFAVILIAVAAE
jgi:hypothetical protein